jgi:hypothetical protein
MWTLRISRICRAVLILMALQIGNNALVLQDADGNDQDNLHVCL